MLNVNDPNDVTIHADRHNQLGTRFMIVNDVIRVFTYVVDQLWFTGFEGTSRDPLWPVCLQRNAVHTIQKCL